MLLRGFNLQVKQKDGFKQNDSPKVKVLCIKVV